MIFSKFYRRFLAFFILLGKMIFMSTLCYSMDKQWSPKSVKEIGKELGQKTTVLQFCGYGKVVFNITLLLMHTVAHFTRLSFRLKTNNQPIFQSSGQLFKSCQNSELILYVKTYPNLSIFFIEEYHFRGMFFVIDIF